MTDPTDEELERVLGHLCPKCGAVMESRKKVLKLKDENIDYEYWKCGYCGYRED